MAKRKSIAVLQADTKLRLLSSAKGGTTPQSLAFVNESEQIILCSNTSKLQICTNSKVKENISMNKNIGHCNGGTYCSKNGYIYGTGESDSFNVYEISKDGKIHSTITLTHASSGIAYDASNNKFYVASGSYVYVYKYDNFLKGKGYQKKIECTKFGTWTSNTYWQDIGGNAGIIMRCVSKKDVASQTAYIDCYDSDSGSYIGSYSYKGAELESVAADSNGNLHVLFATSRYLIKMKTTTSPNPAAGEIDPLTTTLEGQTNAITKSAAGMRVVNVARKYLGEDSKRFKKHAKQISGSSWDTAFLYTIFDECGLRKDCLNSTGLSNDKPCNWLAKNGTVIYKKGDSSSKFQKAKPGDIVRYNVTVKTEKSSYTVDKVEIVSQTPTDDNIKSIGGTGIGTDVVEELIRHKSDTVAIYHPPYAGTSMILGITVDAEKLYAADNFTHYDNEKSPSKQMGTQLSDMYGSLDGGLPADTENNIATISYLTSPGISQRLPNTRLIGNIVAPKLPTALTLIEAPFAEITLGGIPFGLKYNKSYPNYVNGLRVEKTNASMNTYVISLTHQISPGDNPNYIDELISANGYNKIGIKYGDDVGGITYTDTKALLTDVKTNFDFTSCKINYTIKAVSNIIMGSTYKKNYPAAYDKPSNLIWNALYNDNNSILRDTFPAMSSPTYVGSSGWIPTNDIAVETSAYTDIAPFNYVKEMVNLMNNGIKNADNLNLKDSVYVMSINDSDGGAYFKINEIKAAQNVSLTDCSYQVDVGYPDDASVFDFKINNNYAQAMAYKYSDKLAKYHYDLDSSGNLNKVIGLSKYGSDWWTKMTEFPISATLTTRGLLRPVELLTYIKIDCNYFGVERPSSGVYIVVGQTDELYSTGYRTTLDLIKVAGANQYINVDGRVRT